MSNRLASETSPYLLQHADNPVDWYPWSTEAFEHARDARKPVLLSIGYSACHWCHVMAHESFEDDAIAGLMNELFVNVKVDREERPDVDRIYQTAHQLLTGRGGGWPLTMFLNPEDQRPFFGGTYFPAVSRHGMPAFPELLRYVARFYAERHDEILEQGERLDDVLVQLEPPTAADDELSDAPIHKVLEQLTAAFDADYGGFGSAPKFPHPTTIDRLLRSWNATMNDVEPDSDALDMATLTLTRMAEGGIYDHVGGGFCRYSVDRRWQIPHFEKMLYDNGALLATYSHAFLATGDALFCRTAAQTGDWLLADMRAPNGGFYSSRDADSEGEEGKYYVWTPGEVESLLDPEVYAAFAERYGLDRNPNFEGNWHLAVRGTADADLSVIDEARAVLRDARAQRVPPSRDDKQLTAWNALAIRGLAIAGRVLSREEFVEAAHVAAAFLHENLFVDGRLLASFKNDAARFPAYLDDYAFLIDALLELLQSRWDSDVLHFALELADLVIAHFEDHAQGGFFFTADDHETLIHRPKPLADEAMPSGNGVAALALQRLGHLIGEQRYIDAAARTLCAAWRAMSEYPQGHVTLLAALEEYLDPPEIVVMRGESENMKRWSDSLAKLYAPGRVLISIPGDVTALPGLLAERQPRDGEAIAYRCSGRHCEIISEGQAL